MPVMWKALPTQPGGGGTSTAMGLMSIGTADGACDGMNAANEKGGCPHLLVQIAGACSTRPYSGA